VPRGTALEDRADRERDAPLAAQQPRGLGVRRIDSFALAPARSRICAVPAMVGRPRTFADGPAGRAVALSRHAGPAGAPADGRSSV
jgi:hypothetical protein